jgi:hypothetical protein
VCLAHPFTHVRTVPAATGSNFSASLTQHAILECMYKYQHAYIHIYADVSTRKTSSASGSRSTPSSLSHTHTHIHAHTHTHKRTPSSHTYIYIHAHTHTHTQALRPLIPAQFCPLHSHSARHSYMHTNITNTFIHAHAGTVAVGTRTVSSASGSRGSFSASDQDSPPSSATPSLREECIDLDVEHRLSRDADGEGDGEETARRRRGDGEGDGEETALGSSTSSDISFSRETSGLYSTNSTGVGLGGGNLTSHLRDTLMTRGVSPSSDRLSSDRDRDREPGFLSGLSLLSTSSGSRDRDFGSREKEAAAEFLDGGNGSYVSYGSNFTAGVSSNHSANTNLPSAHAHPSNSNSSAHAHTLSAHGNSNTSHASSSTRRGLENLINLGREPGSRDNSLHGGKEGKEHGSALLRVRNNSSSALSSLLKPWGMGWSNSEVWICLRIRTCTCAMEYEFQHVVEPVATHIRTKK